MRLIHTINDQKKGLLLSTFLSAEGIENQLEIVSNTDWGSSNYGEVSCKLWIVDEDKVEKAQQFIQQFEADPENPMYQKKVVQVSPVILPAISRQDFPNLDAANKDSQQSSGSPKYSTKPTQRLIKISTTFYLIMLCCILFIVDMMTEPKVTLVDTNLPIMPQVASPLKKACLYDYPMANVITDKLLKLYSIEQLQHPESLPSNGKFIFAELNKTPYWQGAYNLVVNKYFHHKIPASDPPLFEKIRNGEVWRLITPCVMHHDILHLLFNMLWLVVLGQQMEQRLGGRRYIFFALLVGVFSNTCQYLMSGPDFIGYSGIICGMLTFIWVRQKIAAWEGYPLQKATINFMIFFIVAMMGIQLVSFYLEIYHQISISPGIANTAHLSGAAFGALLGRLSFFSWRT